ncbi:DUF413 domain-containing protein [Thalassotalea sp. G2M2-11]|uniref:DUF413 domain-containing protein n=1 Tax=Thalassotalea sp. G2M2-11 TaxID=2787627 RepID=UPI0019D0E5E0|nr:DUF413 domain-containing protein [Thalassotalea sp. G2M2-11]
MNLIHGFVQTNKFYDDVHFPRGFSRSGKFSIRESELLTLVGRRLSDLEHGCADAENQVEENFVSMCQSSREAETLIERLWLKYKDAIKVKSFHTLNSSAKVHVIEHEEVEVEEY